MNEQDIGLALLADLAHFYESPVTIQVQPRVNQTIDHAVETTLMEAIAAAMEDSILSKDTGNEAKVPSASACGFTRPEELTTDSDWELCQVDTESEVDQESFELVEWDEVVDEEIPDEDGQQ